MSRTLKGLVRLRKWDVDEKRRFLANLLDSEAQVISLLRALEEQGKQERRAASADPMGAGITYGGYACWARGRREELEAALEEIRQRIDVARDLLAEAFKELKTSEIAEEGRLSRETAERQRRENARQDDVGLEIFRRAEKKISLLTRK